MQTSQLFDLAAGMVRQEAVAMRRGRRSGLEWACTVLDAAIAKQERSVETLEALSDVRRLVEAELWR